MNQENPENKALLDYAQEVKKFHVTKGEKKKSARETLMESLTDKEKKYLSGLSKKERRMFINKSLGLAENHGINGPFGKKYF